MRPLALRVLLSVPDRARRPMDVLHRLVSAVQGAAATGSAEEVLWAAWETSRLAQRLEQDSTAGGTRDVVERRRGEPYERGDIVEQREEPAHRVGVRWADDVVCTSKPYPGRPSPRGTAGRVVRDRWLRLRPQRRRG